MGKHICQQCKKYEALFKYSDEILCTICFVIKNHGKIETYRENFD